MKCPRCTQNIHKGAELCPHCDFSMYDLDVLYGSEKVRISKLYDSTGLLRLKERQRLEKHLEGFEAKFPQLFFSVYLGNFKLGTNIREFGMWLLNRGAYVDLELTRLNEGGVLLVVDLNSKIISLSNGYILDPFLFEKDSFNALAKAHPHLIQGKYTKAGET